MRALSVQWQAARRRRELPLADRTAGKFPSGSVLIEAEVCRERAPNINNCRQPADPCRNFREAAAIG
jgi:hypothetical protein